MLVNFPRTELFQRGVEGGTPVQEALVAAVATLGNGLFVFMPQRRFRQDESSAQKTQPGHQRGKFDPSPAPGCARLRGMLFFVMMSMGPVTIS
ncbi:hypothetical protein [Arthrobacter sp. OAP107]|uniref:hypothetical protein n=1 Tax=Arthrobacter sp. OAP107 TaxID=3156445 RepID=UPI003393A7C9